MKINPITISGVQSAYKTGKTSKSVSAPVSSGRDELELSEETVAFAKLLASAKEKISPPSVPDRENIERIKNAITSGEYSVSSADVADSILSALIQNS